MPQLTTSQRTTPQPTVGIRELKARLSSFLRQVRSGNAVVITDRGQAVGQILPMSTSLEGKLRQLASSDIASWSGRKLRSSVPRVPLEGRKTVAEMLLEDRSSAHHVRICR